MADELRISQQAVEVVYIPDIDPTARITAQYVEVIHTTAFITSALAADIQTQAVVGSVLTISGAKLSVSFTGTGALGSKLKTQGEQYPGSLLQLFQEVSLDTVMNFSLESVLEFSDLAYPNKVHEISLTSTLNFVQTVVKGKIRSRSTSSTLNFVQSVSESRYLESILELNHEVSYFFDYLEETPSSTLIFTDSVALELDLELSVESILLLDHEVALTFISEDTLESVLKFKHVAVGTILESYMMLESPYPGPENIIILPKPLVGNTENLVSDMLLKKSMNGIKRTYVKKNLSRRLTYTFSMTREKGLELEHFFKLHSGDDMKLTTWEGEIWQLYLITNPIDFNQPRRGAHCGATVEVDLEFEGRKISG